MVLDKLIEVVRATGRIGVVGVYNPEDPGAATEDARQGRYGFNYGLVFDKAISMGHGQCPVKRYNHQLRDLIIRGKAHPSLIVSHELPLDRAPDAYARFDQREDGWTKVLLKPGYQAA
jgi:glutathione-independent formaldehyde dehydrogenase